MKEALDEEELTKGSIKDEKLWENTRAFKTGFHEIDNKRITVIRPRPEAFHVFRLEDHLAEILSTKEEECGPTNPYKDWLRELSDEELIDHLFEKIDSPSPSRYDEVNRLSKIWLYDDRGIGAAQLHKPVRNVFQIFLIEGCPRTLLCDLAAISSTALEKWNRRLGQKSYRFQEHIKRQSTFHLGHKNAELVYWRGKLCRFTIVALKLYRSFRGEIDEFYDLFLSQYLETGIFRPDIIQSWSKEAEGKAQVCTGVVGNCTAQSPGSEGTLA